MKRCPSCHLTYAEVESFCHSDGAPLMRDAPAYDLQATIAAPQVYSNSGNLTPFNPFPADAGGYSHQQHAPNPSWGVPSLPQYAAAPPNAGLNKKVLVGVIAGVLLLGVVGIVLFYTRSSGPPAKMNPYKGSLESFAPKDIKKLYERTEVNKVADNDKEGFGNVKEALGVAYSSTIRDENEMSLLVVSYSSAEDARDGLSKFKNKVRGAGWAITEEGDKKNDGSKVGLRFTASRPSASGNAGERYLPDGAAIVLVQNAAPRQAKEAQVLVCWTNGSVLFVAAGQGGNALHFESNYDTAIEGVTK